MTEIWRDIAGYDGLYQVSNLGRVRSFKQKTPRILKLKIDKGGYLRINLCRNGKYKSALVHRLVAQAFIPNPDGKREVNHIDGNPRNSHVTNLEWCTSSENHKHAYDTGLRLALQGEDSPQSKLANEQVRFIRDNPDGLNTVELARMFGVVPATISEIQCGKYYQSAGGAIRKPRHIKRAVHLPDNIREQIRREYKPGVPGYGCHVLAKKYGVNPQTICNIVKEGDIA